MSNNNENNAGFNWHMHNINISRVYLFEKVEM
jgi:hypothetical protein